MGFIRLTQPQPPFYTLSPLSILLFFIHFTASYCSFKSCESRRRRKSCNASGMQIVPRTLSMSPRMRIRRQSTTTRGLSWVRCRRPWHDIPSILSQESRWSSPPALLSLPARNSSGFPYTVLDRWEWFNRGDMKPITSCRRGLGR